jgi:periplasmic divalent cation tolerance protein
MTASRREEALEIGRALVNERLVACVNVLDGMTSLYWWKGEVQEESEAVLVAKTLSDRVPRVISRIREMHSYECPCVVALPIVQGNAPFLEWIGNEVNAAGGADKKA